MTPRRTCDPVVTYPYFYSLLKNKGSNLCNTTMLICGDFFVNTATTTNDWKNIANKFDEDIIFLIRNADISLVNLESPATLSSNKIQKSGPSLRMNPYILSNIRRIGFNGVTLANNHIMDFGPKGLMDTLSAAKALGLLTCGAGLNNHEAIQPMITERPDGLKIFVLSFCEKEFGVSDKSTPGSAWISHPSALSKVEECRDFADFILVIAHGGLEHIPLSPPERQAQLRQFIDAGADMVIGHHPHVPQGWEKYNGRYIFHSIGNFIFDDRGGPNYPETEWGFMIQLRFDSSKIIDIGLILTENKKGVVKLMADESSLKNKIEYLNFLSNILQNPELYYQYWQEMAIRRYYDQYAHLISPLLFPERFIAVFNRIRRYFGKNPIYPRVTTDPKEIHVRDLAFLNIIRNESHSWAIRRALSIITLQEPDLRFSDTKYQIDQLFKWSKGRPLDGAKSINPILTEVDNS